MTSSEFLSAWVRARAGNCERGASLVEYALLLALIAVVCIAAVSLIGTSLSDNYDNTHTSIFGS